MENGRCSLADLIEAGRKYDEPEIMYFLKNVSHALYIAQIQKRITHRDLKPPNFILDDDFCSFKIADFEESVFVESKDDLVYELVVGSPDYMAPEMYRLY